MFNTSPRTREYQPRCDPGWKKDRQSMPHGVGVGWSRTIEGEVLVELKRLGAMDDLVRGGDRIAQLLILPVIAR